MGPLTALEIERAVEGSYSVTHPKIIDNRRSCPRVADSWDHRKAEVSGAGSSELSQELGNRHPQAQSRPASNWEETRQPNGRFPHKRARPLHDRGRSSVSMYEQRSHLAEDTFRDVAWSLGCQANIQSILPTFFCNQFEGVKVQREVFGAD